MTPESKNPPTSPENDVLGTFSDFGGSVDSPRRFAPWLAWDDRDARSRPTPGALYSDHLLDRLPEIRLRVDQELGGCHDLISLGQSLEHLDEAVAP